MIIKEYPYLSFVLHAYCDDCYPTVGQAAEIRGAMDEEDWVFRSRCLHCRKIYGEGEGALRYPRMDYREDKPDQD